MKIGIDLGGHTIILASFDDDLELISSLELETPASRTIQDVAGLVARELDCLVDRGVCKAIGIGIPGMLDRERQQVLKMPNFPGWEGLKVPSLFSRIIGKPVFMENDANCFALGEQYRGLGQGVEDFIVLTLGTGIGGGVILSGQLLFGAHGMAGELGHIATGGKKRCGCGAMGHVETESAADGLEKAAIAKGLMPVIPELWKLRDSPEVTLLWGNALDSLARAICSCIHVLDPRLIILGGGISRADGFLDYLEPYIGMYLAPPYREGVQIRVSKLGNMAAVIGAASLVNL